MTMHYRTTVSAGGGFDFVISDGTMDRHGTRINPHGWDLSEFLKNPQALWAHGRDPVRGSLPIGRWENVRVEAGSLIGRLILAEEGSGSFTDEIRRLVRQGILRAVSVGMDYIKEGKRGGPWEIERAGLREVSLVAVGSNPNALALARSLDISESTLRTVFGEHANEDNRVVSTGEHAVTSDDRSRSREDVRPIPKETTMKTVSQRLEEAQNKLALKQARHAELINADELDTDAVRSVSAEIARLEGEVEVLTESEAKIGKAAERSAPAINRMPLGYRQKEVKPLDMLVRATLVNACAMFGNKGLDQVLNERYPDHDLTHALVRATEAPLLTTGGSHAVSDLQQISYQGFIDALDGASVLPALRSRGMNLTFDNNGTVFIPGVAADGAEGSFFAEGGAIRVGTLLTTGVQMTAKQMGVIIPFSRQSAQRSTPNLEGIIKSRIIAGSAKTIDSHLLDNVAPDVGTARPGGLLYDQVGSSTIAAAASGFGGGDHVSVIEDFKALLAPFIDANAADGITVIMNPAQGFAIDAMTGADGALGDWFGRVRSRFTFVESTHATKGRLIAVRSSDFASAFGGLRFEESNTATVHMEQEAATVSADVGSTTTKVRSFFQTDSMGIRMVLDTNWRMVRQGMVAWVDGTSY